MTSPKHARDTDNGRYYTHPQTGQQLISVTNVLGALAKFGLPHWYARLAAEYAIDHLPELVVQARTDPGAALAQVKDQAEQARDKAANLGTRVHDLAEAHLTGKEITEEEGDREAGLFVKQYLKFLEDFQVNLDRDVYAAELTVANPALGYAGTLDAILALRLDGFLVGEKVKRLPDGQRALWMLDTKTSSTRTSTQVYPEHALQLTALKHCTEMWLPDDTVVPMVSSGITGCAVLNLRPKKYRLIPLPTRTVEFNAFRSLMGTVRWIHDDWPGDFDYRPVTPAGAFVPKQKKSDPTMEAD